MKTTDRAYEILMSLGCVELNYKDACKIIHTVLTRSRADSITAEQTVKLMEILNIIKDEL
jgi:hypothetical protein